MKLPGSVGKQPRKLALELPAIHAAVRQARNVVRSFARMCGLPGREVETLMLVASELLGNAVDHGGGGGAMDEGEMAGSVRMALRLEFSGQSWSLEVDDQGGGDPAEVQELLTPSGFPDLEDERGRGFFLMAQMVDQMSVRRSQDGLGLTIFAVHAFQIG